MAANSRELVIKISADDKDFKKKLSDAEKQLKDFANSAGKSGAGISSLDDKLHRSAEKARRLGDSFEYASKKILLGFSIVSGGIGALISQAGRMEQWKISFDTMLGSVEKSKKLMSEIKDFAKKTPFELTDLVENSKQLLAYGFSADEILPTLRNLGDISAGLGTDKLPSLILALGQVRSATRLYGTELRQFREAGVPMLEILSEHLGKTTEEIELMITRGDVSFQDVTKSLDLLTQKGGRFYNLMNAQSKTVFGKLSNIKDEIVQIAMSLGERLLPATKKILDEILKILKSFQSLPEKTKDNIVHFLLLTAKILAISLALSVASAAFFKFRVLYLEGLIQIRKRFDDIVKATAWLRSLAGIFFILSAGAVYLASKTDIGRKSILILVEILKYFKNFTRIFVTTVVKDFKIFGSILKSAFTLDLEGIKRSWEELKAVTKEAGEQIDELVYTTGETISSLWAESAEKTKDRFEKLGSYFTGWLSKFRLDFSDTIEKLPIDTGKATNESQSHFDIFFERIFRNLDEFSRRFKLTFEDSFSLGVNLFNDFSGTVRKILTEAFTGPDGVFAQTVGRAFLHTIDSIIASFGSIKENINEAVSGVVGDVAVGSIKGKINEAVSGVVGGVAGSLGSAQKPEVKKGAQWKSFLGTFLGGVIPGIAGAAISGLVGMLFDSFSSTQKTFEEISQESFDRLVNNVNRALDNIGKEKTRLESQVRVLSEIKEKSDLGVDAVIPKEFTKALGVEFGTTVKAALENLQKSILGQEKAKRDAIEGSVSAAEKAIGVLSRNKQISDVASTISLGLFSRTGETELDSEREARVEQAISDLNALEQFQRLGRTDAGQLAQLNLIEKAREQAVGTKITDLGRAVAEATGITEAGMLTLIDRAQGKTRLNVDAMIDGLSRFVQEKKPLLESSSSFTIDQILDNFQTINQISSILGTKPDISSATTGIVPSNRIGINSFAVGTTNVPSDMLANIHKGEMIIPTSFASKIRAGELKLSGGGQSSTDQSFNVGTISNTININAGSKDPGQLWQEIRPFATGQAVKTRFASYSGVFQ